MFLLKTTECSSCALEYDRSQVALFIHKDIPNLDYIDIATELTTFVCKKPLDTLVHSISDKLASALETLKRRGIPVDRLLKTPEQQRNFDIFCFFFVKLKNIFIILQQSNCHYQLNLRNPKRPLQNKC